MTDDPPRSASFHQVGIAQTYHTCPAQTSPQLLIWHRLILVWQFARYRLETAGPTGFEIVTWTKWLEMTGVMTRSMTCSVWRCRDVERLQKVNGAGSSFHICRRLYQAFLSVVWYFLGINRLVFSSFQKEAHDINNCISESSETSFLLGVCSCDFSMFIDISCFRGFRLRRTISTRTSLPFGLHRVNEAEEETIA